MELTQQTTAPGIFGHHLETLVKGQAEVFARMSSSEPLPSVLTAIVEWVESQSDSKMKASILLMDGTGQHLLHGAAPSLPAAYNEAIHGITIGSAVGSCGTAAFTREMVIVDDISTNILWADFKDLAMAHGLQACWSTPLLNKAGEVLGTFAVYYAEPRHPSTEDMKIINMVSQTTVIAIEYVTAEEEKQKALAVKQEMADQVKKERQHFYQLLMHAPAMIAVLRGPEHVFELTNKLYQLAVGVDRDLAGKPVGEALPEIVSQGFIDILDNVYRTQKPFFGNEIQIMLDRSATGLLEERYFNFVYQPIRSESGESEGIFVHAVDVTEQVNARKRAEASEEEFKSFVMNAPMPIAIYLGREMRVHMVNDALLEAWGKGREVVGKTFRESLPELEGQPFYQLLDDVYTTGIPYQATEDRVDLVRNGKLEVTYFNFTYKALKNSAGEIYGVINTAAEVTELVRAKQNLAETRQDLANAIELTTLGTWSVGMGSSQALEYSARAAEWFNLPEQGASLDQVFDAILEEDRGRVRAALEHALQHGELYEAEYRAIGRGGQTRILHALGRVFKDESGRELKMNGIVQDMTMQRMNEQELERQVAVRTVALQKANSDLQKMNDSLQQFVYIASHDLQEPLRKINMFADLLRERSRESLSTVAMEYLTKITDGAQRMSHLIKDLLDYSRASNQEHGTLSNVELAEVIRNVTADYELVIREKQATLTVDSAISIEAVPLQMNQLFYNLIGNALKFSMPGRAPVIHISCRRMPSSELDKYEGLTRQYSYCEIVVSDNGIGFQQHFAEQIFVIFQRLHGKQEYDGTGIGLAICKKIVDNHEGLIYARSQEGQGTSFHVLLPERRG